MKIAVIDFGIADLATVCRFVAKGYKVAVFEKNIVPNGISFCLASAKIVDNEIRA